MIQLTRAAIRKVAGLVLGIVPPRGVVGTDLTGKDARGIDHIHGIHARDHTRAHVIGEKTALLRSII